MKVTREELIYIHKRIWNGVHQYIHNSCYKTNEIPLNLHYVKDVYIYDMLNENKVSQKVLEWVYENSSCVFCALFSADFCNNCPLHDCTTPYSLYQLVLNGSEEACVKIRDLIYKADIPEHIEIPEE